MGFSVLGATSASQCLYAWSSGDSNLACGADYRDYARLDGIVALPNAACQSEDGGSIVDGFRSLPGAPAALVAATTRWMATYCVLPLRSAALPDILRGRLTSEIGTWATTFWGLTIAGLWRRCVHVWAGSDGLVDRLGFWLRHTPLPRDLRFDSGIRNLVPDIGPRRCDARCFNPVFVTGHCPCRCRFGLGEVMTLPLALSACAIVGGIVIAQRA